MQGGARLEWLPHTPVSTSCPVCAGSDSTALVSVDDPYTPGESFAFARCPACRTVFLSDPERHISHDAGLDDEAFLTWYLESGAGIDAMLQPLLALPLPRGGTFLDVGCGFGFSTWFAQQHLGMQALGLERASYGAIGAAALAIEILPQYVDANSARLSRRFEVVHCSEVIEHVADPRAFLRELRALCDDRGLLILTTPDADVVEAGTSPAVTVEALSPGLHRFLLNRRQLLSLLDEAGFPVQHVVQNGGHLVVWASAIPLPEPHWAVVEKELHTNVLRELVQVAEPALHRGALYRLLRHYVVAGDIAEAQAVRADLTQVLTQVFGDDRLDVTGESLDRYVASTPPPGRPSFLGPLYYWLGLLATHERASDVATRVRFFADALTLLTHAVQTRPQYAHEDAALIDTARFHLLQVALQTIQRELPLVAAGPFAERAADELAPLGSGPGDPRTEAVER